jgi:hypothetical protein
VAIKGFKENKRLMEHDGISHEIREKLFYIDCLQHMLPYHRDPSESYGPMNAENSLTWDMMYTPYETNKLSSSTDSAYLEVDTNAVNPWYRNVAYTASQDPDYTTLFGKESVNWMSAQITLRLKGVHPEGKDIAVPDSTILSVADSWFQKTQLTVEMLQEMIILHIVNQVRNDYELTKNNDKLTAWVQLYSMDTGLRQWSQPEDWVNQKRRTYAWSWNY